MRLETNMLESSQRKGHDMAEHNEEGIREFELSERIWHLTASSGDMAGMSKEQIPPKEKDRMYRKGTSPESIKAAEEAKEEFIAVWEDKVVPVRGGQAERLLRYLDGDSCDFFIAPASARYHGSVYGGLVRHSMSVYWCLLDVLGSEVYQAAGLAPSDDTVAIVALLHDLCKANFYVPEIRNRKKADDSGWEKYVAFGYADSFPYGHGEKSVLMASHYMELTFEEAMAIRHHMGFSGSIDTEVRSSFSNAVRQYPLCLALNEADTRSTLLIEK